MNTTTISWRNQDDLDKVTKLLLKGILTDTLIKYFNKNRPEYFVSDDSSWLRKGILSVHGIHIENPFEYFAKKIKENIVYLRVYHGCKPIDFESYFKEGFYPLQIDSFITSTAKRFQKFDITETHIKEAIKKVSTETREGRLWFVIDDRTFFNGAGHYLIYGGEYLQAIAGNIQKTIAKPLQSHLEQTGVPTVFICEIPISMIDEEDILNLSGAILENYFEKIFNERNKDQRKDFGFSISASLPAKYLVGHYHPEEIENPIYGRTMYYSSKTTCPYCQ